MPSRHPTITSVRHYLVIRDGTDVLGHVSVHLRSDGFRYVGEAALRTSARMEDILSAWALWVTERAELTDIRIAGHTYTLQTDANGPLADLRRYLHATRVQVKRDEIDHPTYAEMMEEIERIMQDGAGR